jgi:hypothetical protein
VARLAAWVRGTGAPATGSGKAEDIRPDRGTLAGLEDQIGRTFLFRVTGSATGQVWGTDVYTADSALATAAVHAGVLRAGETRVVRVRLLAGRSAYRGSTRHGVTSGAWTAYPAAYTVTRPPK